MDLSTSPSSRIELLPIKYSDTYHPKLTQRFPLGKVPAFGSLKAFKVTEGAVTLHKWNEEHIVRSVPSTQKATSEAKIEGRVFDDQSAPRGIVTVERGVQTNIGGGALWTVLSAFTNSKRAGDLLDP
ncbi:hypothetical protein EDD15DRAFT_2195973 [Pisolithus albus]|nr:hypothetical protein EDD15DRAFT_2195973 [Pisolithus albus]